MLFNKNIIMEKGKLQIRIDSANNHIVECYLKNGSIWMDRHELCELFGCYMRDIDRCIEDIFTKKLLHVEDTCKYHIVAGGRRVSYDITAVNLTVIITMAFRLETTESQTLRLWFVEQVAKMRSFDILFPDIGENFRFN